MQTHFYFSVAKNGLHLFRTVWYPLDWEHQSRIKKELVRSFPGKYGYTIQLYTRDKSMKRVDVDN